MNRKFIISAVAALSILLTACQTEQSPTSEDLRALEAYSLIDQKRYIEAKQILYEILEDYPDNESIRLTLMSTIMMESGFDIKKIEEIIKEGLRAEQYLAQQQEYLDYIQVKLENTDLVKNAEFNQITKVFVDINRLLIILSSYPRLTPLQFIALQNALKVSEEQTVYQQTGSHLYLSILLGGKALYYLQNRINVESVCYKPKQAILLISDLSIDLKKVVQHLKLAFPNEKLFEINDDAFDFFPNQVERFMSDPQFVEAFDFVLYLFQKRLGLCKS